MGPRWACVALLSTFVALNFVQGDDRQNKRSKPLWYKAKAEHEGIGLSDGALQAISRLSDMNHFKSVLKPILVPRVVGSQNHANVRKHLVNTMRDLKWTVEEDSFVAETPLGPKTFTNVLATLDPAAPRRLVLACHYESKIHNEGPFVGATDSAVPCAMMLNLAKMLQTSLNQHQKTGSSLTLQFIFFDGEEAFHQWSATDSLYGARNLAAKMEARSYPDDNVDNIREIDRIDLLVLLDLLGTQDVKFSSYFSNTDHWYARFVLFENQMNELGLLHRRNFMFQKKTAHHYSIEDDHVPFLKRGVQVLHLIPAPFPKVWHTSDDNGSALHYPSIENLNKILCAFVADYLHLFI